MRRTTPTVSIRKGSLIAEIWLQRDGSWGAFETRWKIPPKRLEKAIQANVRSGDYGVFQNSVSRRID